jgi:predicted GH43/DUF377 family glycosyl hydrolase
MIEEVTHRGDTERLAHRGEHPEAKGDPQAATSGAEESLLHWTPCPEGEPIHRPTPGDWDGTLVEIGAPPVTTSDGLMVFLTNGATATSPADVDYRCGQIAIARSKPTEVIARSTVPWLRPQTVEERHGLVSNVTFVEGLVQFDGRWLAYYGQSDTTLAVAVFDPSAVSYHADG